MKKIPKTVSFSGEQLSLMKREGNIPAEALEALRKRADEQLASPMLAVTLRNARAISKNPHDYASFGPYWWPNPDTPNGLPYVRRDGEIVPGSIEEITPRLMARKVLELALAAFYFDSEEYGRAAEKALYDWHLNPETYMTPHAEYAQAIPGICTGRGIGIVDFAYSYQVLDAAAILDSLGYISEENLNGLKAWYSDFADWMLTSENGLTEDTEPNNHGTFYDIQLLAIALFTDRRALADKICKTAYSRRFAAQIEPDGKMPLELARTMAIHYSLANIRAYCVLANMAESNGHPEFYKDASDGGKGLLRSAIDYIYQYVINPESFPYKESYSAEVYPSIPDMMLMALMFADAHYPDCGYDEKIKNLRGVSSYILRPGK